MTTLFTSDWHFGHTNILTYCPQRLDYLNLKPNPSVTDMNEMLVLLWNSQVNDGDEVFVIGDMCMGRVDETIEYVGRLNGTKYLVLGNHDKPHPGITRDPEKRQRWHERYAEFFREQFVDLPMCIDGIDVQINHFPFAGNDHTEGGARYNADIIERYTPTDTTVPLVHGHVHDLYQTRGGMLNVGIDAWAGRMVTPEQIATYFRSQGFA